MWTDHCEQTGDSGFPQDLVVDEENDVVFEKGTNDYTDGYSPFFDNTGRISTGLGEILQDNGIEDIVLVGIAFDYAIRYAANHAKNLGYDVSVIADASAVIDQQVALDTTTEMIANKVSILSSDDIIKMEC
ncbi:unnamed protein product [Cylindrotheca closterium]|uniref:nicotinamidase n=1 Tax=Cylindrotheca closterium TaxID=2856 RepID=A0AAD2G8Q2_9STRA|nr:unnamed protein product [Cylindrotheca closterium]